MQKLFLVIPVFLLLVTSCNFPLAANSNTSSMVSTNVAQTVQAAAQPTATSTSNAVIVVITATPNPTQAQTQTATPTATPVDPKSTLGSPVYAENFASGSAFDLKTPYSDDAVTIAVADGKLTMTSSRINGGIRWRRTYPSPHNFYLEGTFNAIACSGDDYYGLNVRSHTYFDSPGYYFAISCSGKYLFMWMDSSDQKHILADWTTDSAIIQGQGQTNRLGIWADGDHFRLYINGKLVKELDDGNINAQGYFGVFLSAVDTPNMTVEVKQLYQWDLPQE